MATTQETKIVFSNASQSWSVFHAGNWHQILPTREAAEELVRRLVLRDEQAAAADRKWGVS